MADLVTALRAEVASLEHQIDTWKSLVAHIRGVTEVPILTVSPDGATFRVTMSWNSEWALAEFGCMLAVVVKHIAHNADLEEDQLLFAVDHALDQMQGEQVVGGRVM